MSYKRVNKTKSVTSKKKSTNKNQTAKKKTTPSSIRSKIIELFNAKDYGQSAKAEALMKELKTTRIPKKQVFSVVKLMIDQINIAREGISYGDYNRIETGIYRAELLAELLRDNARKYGNSVSGINEGYEFEQFAEVRAYLSETYTLMDEPEDWWDIDYRLDDAIGEIPGYFPDY